jgi:CheY-like chemotaxis protein
VSAIFLCEDQALLRMMLVDIVEELGHRIVAEASNVRDALALAEISQFDLALLDINIAGESVGPVADVVKRRGLPILFVSGYKTTGLPHRFTKDRYSRSRTQSKSSRKRLNLCSRLRESLRNRQKLPDAAP